jgi:hypothetical protein
MSSSPVDPDENGSGYELPVRPAPSVFKRLAIKLHWKAYLLLPNRIPHPYGEDLEYEQSRDQVENNETCVPADVGLSVPFIWGVELYGPSEIDALYESLKKLDWLRVGAWNEKETVLDWVQQTRMTGTRGWMNVGVVRRLNSPRGPFGTDNTAKLPAGVESLLVRVIQATPSLTAVKIGFQLTESVALCYENEINRPRSSQRRPNRRLGSVSIFGPDNLKQEGVEHTRLKLRDLVASWFEQNMPGFFCGLQKRGAVPVMELLTARDVSILDWSSTSDGIVDGWRRFISRAPPYDVWSLPDSGLQLDIVRRRWNEPEGLHVVAALTCSHVPDKALVGRGARSPWTYSLICDDALDELLVHLALIEYLKYQASDVKLTRAGLKRAGAGGRVKSLAIEISRFFDRMLGAPAIARELAEQSKNAGAFGHSCPKFTSPRLGALDKLQDLPEHLRAYTHFLAAKFNDEEAAMREHLEQMSTVLSVRESIKAQRRMEWLTLIALVIAAGSLLVAMPRWDEFTTKLKSWTQISK